MTPIIPSLRLRAHTPDTDRKVTWLELFFDLVFVAAVAQVAEPLHEHYSVGGVVRFATLFALIWWAWTGYALFATRFDGSDAVHRGLTLVQMFVVAAMAANAGDELDSRSTAGFAAAYAALRFVLVAQYLRARHIPEARPLTTRYVVGHGAAACVWLASAFIPAPARYAAWAAAFAIDLGTPWLALPHSVRVPPDPAHLPERFGLFTLILLGEAVVAVMHGMKSHEDWTAAAGSSAFLGMALVFLVWWWYFGVAGAASERVVRTRADALRFYVWSYAHFPLYLGVVVLAVGVERFVTAAARSTPTPADTILLMSAAAVMSLSMSAIAVTAAARSVSVVKVGSGLALSLAIALAGFVVAAPAPAAAIAGLIGVCGVQMWIGVCGRAGGRALLPWRDGKASRTPAPETEYTPST